MRALWLLLLCTVRALGQAYDYGVNIDNLIRRQDNDARIVVTQLPPSPNGTIPSRPEIRQMKRDQPKWNLFILALSMFQYIDQDDPHSWYQIAGIHGVPFVTWNGVTPAPGASQSGYCTHSSVLFPLWHRPYLALFEQEMYRMVNIIANMYTNDTQRSAYKRAAAEFRLPYWDWSLEGPPGESHFPSVFWDAVISQEGPNGVQNIKNPLYSYEFDPLDEDALIWSPLKHWHETKRSPDTNVSADSPPSRNQDIDAALRSKLPEIQQRLFILFSNYRDFNSFGNKAWAVSQNLSYMDSIESVHDIIHTYGGLTGHMTYVPLSAFDPLFLVHHVMTDRLVAIWQQLNPEGWVTPMAAGETSYNSVKGTVQDASSPLTPFYASKSGDFWTSDSARTTEAFGYVYDDLRPPNGPNVSRSEVAKKIARWYGKFSQAHFDAQSTDSSSTANKENVSNEAPTSQSGPVELEAKKKKTYYEWITNVEIDARAFIGSLDIQFFFNKTKAVTDVSIGSVPVFGMGQMGSQDQQSQSRVSGTLPLTSALANLVKLREIGSLSPQDVQPFLRENLRFHVLDVSKDVVQTASVRGLRISVSSAQVTEAADGQDLPVWGPIVQRFALWSS